LIAIAAENHSVRRDVLEWLRLEHAVDKPTTRLTSLFSLTEEDYLAEVKKSRKTNKTLSVGAIKGLREGYAKTVSPARERCQKCAQLEGRISDVVNAAYGLTEQEVQLIWQTAPPRMPLAE
jgi:hypothetical protein